MTTPVETKNQSNEVNDSYSRIDGMLNEISNSVDSKKSRDELNQLLTQEFLGNFVNGLTEDQKNNLANNIKKIYDKFKGKANFDKDNFDKEYKGLLTLAQSLGFELGGDDVSKEKEDVQISLGLKGELGELDQTKDETKRSIGKGISKNKPENESAVDVEGKLYEAADDINNQIKQIEPLLQNEKLKDNEDLKNLNKLLQNILVVIDNPTKDNVKKLQKFFYSNMEGTLTQEDITEFKTKNFYDENTGEFDGKFGKNTLKWLKEGLKNTQNYINDLKQKEGIKDNMMEPTLGLDGEFEDPSKEKGEPSLGKGVCDDESKDDGSIDEYGKLYKVVGDVNNQKGQIDELLKNEKLKENKDLTYLKALMENISTVLDNPTEDNVRKLQNYIFSNMEGNFRQEDITEFKTKNFDKNKNQFDGKLGKNTIKWLKEGLKKTQNYINDLNEYVKQDNPEKANGEGGDADNKDKDNKDKEKTGGSTDTAPLQIGEDKFLVVENSVAVSRECHISNAIFYSVVSSGTKVDKLSDGTYPKASLDASAGGKREYYMKLPNNPDIYYKVEVDASGNLCPIATEYNRQLKDENGKPLESKILISNNDSCKRYLHNKLPDAIRNSGISIGWDNIGKDYTLLSHGGALTIEPLSIAGDRISNDKSIPIDQRISRNLAFINLTNYVRSLGKKFKKKDPDINSDLELKGIKVEGKKVRIDKNLLGLGDATSGEFSRFKKYNNGEHWRDDWDSKEKNKYYRKIIIK